MLRLERERWVREREREGGREKDRQIDRQKARTVTIGWRNTASPSLPGDNAPPPTLRFKLRGAWGGGGTAKHDLSRRVRRRRGLEDTLGYLSDCLRHFVSQSSKRAIAGRFIWFLPSLLRLREITSDLLETVFKVCKQGDTK